MPAAIVLAGAVMARQAQPKPASTFAAAAVALAASVVVGKKLLDNSAGSGSGGGSAAFAGYPGQYVARRGTPSHIDGNVFKPEWEQAPWSEPFLEIRGPTDAPDGTGPTEAHVTRMKMLWDDDYLYVAAVLDYPAGDELVAKFTERNSPIFHTDSDFEVFVDPAGCCHGYKELELNAINTVWNLMLSRPYSDGGGELSGRVAKPGEASYWEVKAQKTATRVTRGALHRPGEPAQWCCELALAHADTLHAAPVQGPRPAVGRSWRINFSRVEKGGAVNWVWSPQVVWSPEAQRYKGEVNMHLPDAWGYVLFADAAGSLAGGASGDADGWRDPEWPARRAALAAYYAAREFQKTRQRPPASAEELQEGGLLSGADLSGVALTVRSSGERPDGWDITASVGGFAATVASDRLLRVEVAAQ